jgi:anti-anti-sigma factor
MMDTNVVKDGERIVISPLGNLDTKGAADLQNALDKILEDGARVNAVIDFSSVPFVSSAGLRVLLLAMKKINADGGSLELRNVSDSIKEVLKMTGFSSIFNVV